MMYIRIPKERVGVVIGPSGATRKELEERSGVRIEVDSDENEVTVHDQAADPIMAMKVRDVVKAIARGFPPEKAQRLFSDDCYFELVDIHEYTGKHKGHVRRVTSRIVGSEGRTRKIIEDQTGCDLAIYGHTVGIIGELIPLGQAKHAVDMILRGAEHASVYRYLENQRRKSRPEWL